MEKTPEIEIRQTERATAQCRCIIRHRWDDDTWSGWGECLDIQVPDSPFCAGCADRHREKNTEYWEVSVA